MSGREEPCLEKNDSVVVDDQEIIVPSWLIVCGICQGEKALLSPHYTAIHFPSRNNPPQICWALSSNN